MSYDNPEKPKTPSDRVLSARHLRDTIRFNEAHADDHDKEAKAAKKRLDALEDEMDDAKDAREERGASPRKRLSALGQRTLQGFKRRYGNDAQTKFDRAIKAGTLSADRMHA